MTSALTALAGLARQGVRSAAYFGLGEITGRMARRHAPQMPRYKSERPSPSRNALFAAVWDLMQRDAELVRTGVCPPFPADDGSPLQWLARVRAMMADVPEAARRAAEGESQEVRSHAPAATGPAESDAERLPDYYLQNFHYQSGGYLTAESARLYDIQVETLFMGTASLMRRQALAPIAEFMRGRDQRQMRLTDVACGTGRFLRQVMEVYPRLNVTGMDLSAAYLDEARDHLRAAGRDRSALRLVHGNAERLPHDDASQDIVTVIFLFHELPAPIRRQVAREMARVLKPGGLLVFLDSAQYGDVPGWDGALESFPHRFHEPYYRHYLEDDLDAVFTSAGLLPQETRAVMLSKLMVRRKATG
jgi:ubiquinone/menaquinone biosynthesis C-methylase UbiE